jgi:oligopeptide transport system permease protein
VFESGAEKRVLIYALRRIAGLVPTLFVLLTLSVFHHPARTRRPVSTRNRPLPPSIRANLDAAYGLDQPLLTQYGRYLGGVVRGDLGPSFRFKDFRVTELIAAGLPLSLTIGFAATLLALLLGVPLGVFAAWRADSWPARALMNLSMLGVVLPGYVVGPVLALVFGIYWPLFRVAGYEPATRASWCCRWSRWRCRSSPTWRSSRAAACRKCCSRTSSAPRAPRG